MGQLTETGYQPIRAIDAIASIRADFEARTGLVPDWGRDTVLGNLTAIMGEREAATDEAVAQLFAAFDPDNAVGSLLTSIALLVGVARGEATKSVATVTLGGTATTLVPSGSLVEGGGPEGVSRWRTSANCVIPGDVEVVAEEYGAVVASAGQIDTIVSLISGWATVTNAVAAATGREADNDAALRLKRAGGLAAQGSKSRAALRARLLQIDEVEAALVVENTSNDAETVQGISLDPHSVAVVIAPTGVAAAVKQRVLDTIWQYGVAEGIPVKTVGADVTGTVRAEDVTDKVVGYFEASAIDVEYYALIAVLPGFDEAAVAAAAVAAVLDYYAEVGMGGTVALSEANARVQATPGVRWIEEAAIDGGDGYIVTLDATQIPSQGDVVVEVA